MMDEQIGCWSLDHSGHLKLPVLGDSGPTWLGAITSSKWTVQWPASSMKIAGQFLAAHPGTAESVQEDW